MIFEISHLRFLLKVRDDKFIALLYQFIQIVFISFCALYYLRFLQRRIKADNKYFLQISTRKCLHFNLTDL